MFQTKSIISVVSTSKNTDHIVSKNNLKNNVLNYILKIVTVN